MREARNFLVLRKKNLNLPQNEGEAVVFSQKKGLFAKKRKKRGSSEKKRGKEALSQKKRPSIM